MAERAKSSSKKRSGKRKTNGAASAGHNSGLALGGNISDEVRQRWLDKVEAAQRAVDKAKTPYDSARAKLQNVYKGAEDDGVDCDALRQARRLHKNDRAAVARTYTETGRFLLLMGSPLAVQLELFKTPEWPEAVSANLQGYRAGKSGGNPDECPFLPGSENFDQWRTGYDSGQSELSEELRHAAA
jgi:ribosome modulation factor